MSTPEELISLSRRLRRSAPNRLLAADLFSGAGGLSLGLRRAGIDVILGVDHYPEAVETHAHQFPGMSVDWDLADPDTIEEVAALIRTAGISVIVGGPPCQPFSKAGRSGIRHRVRHGQRDPHDERRDLWRSFIEVVRLARPQAVIMENVPDMALDREMFILRSVVYELEELGYGVEERVVDTWRYGVPQFRQRLIVVGLANRVRFDWPAEAAERVTVWNAIGELPEVKGGWRPDGGADGWIGYDGPSTTFQKAMRDGVPAAETDRLYDHITRPVRDDDARAFELMDPKTRYSDLPAEIRRYRDDIFDDKYKRLDEDDLSRTITAHIAKDGYWYIHPRQGRTLTVREAARLQTFPDWYRFAGGPSAAFKQIGNAVPPRLAEALGIAVVAALDRSEPLRYVTAEASGLLAEWFVGLGERLRVPWLKAATRWQVIVAATVLDRSTPDQVRSVWSMLQLWRTPEDTLANAALLRTVGSMTGRQARVSAMLDLAQRLAADPGVLDDDDRLPTFPGLSRSTAELSMLVVGSAGEDQSEEPVIANQGVLRVASRFLGEPVHLRNKLTDGRLAVARMVGGGSSSRTAHLGLIELASSLCRPVDPVCGSCPLSAMCASAVHQPSLWEPTAGAAQI